jgi:cbb3-type cytochrome oxidase subunit 3
MLLIPAGITVVILAVASLSTDREAFWASFILHLFLLIFFLGSFVSFVLRERKKKR